MRTYLMGQDANDTVMIPPGTDPFSPGKSCDVYIPSSEIWTLESISWMFYIDAADRPELNIDPNWSMMHLTVTVNNFDSNIWTKFPGTRNEGGSAWWAYRNEYPHIPVVGPARARIWAFNVGPIPSTLYVNAIWTVKRQ